jgi:hypothetical protein
MPIAMIGSQAPKKYELVINLKTGIAAACAKVDLHITTLRPSQALQLVHKSGQACFDLWIISVLSCESADPPYSIGLLGVCDKRPSRRTADKPHELAPSHLPATTLIGAS